MSLSDPQVGQQETDTQDGSTCMQSSSTDDDDDDNNEDERGGRC